MVRAEHKDEIAAAARGKSGTAGACIAFLWLLVCAAGPALAFDGEAGRGKAEQCVACHGPDGNSEIPTVPSLAGQQARYLMLALGEFRAGRRLSEQMSQFASSLSDQDIRDLATYFAAQTLAPSTRPDDAAEAEAARQLVQQGRCEQCHGPALAGQEQAPRLAGQQADYLREQLNGFRMAIRGDMDGRMTAAAQALSDTDIDRLADYIAALRAP